MRGCNNETKITGCYIDKRENGTYRVRVHLVIDGEKIKTSTTYRPDLALTKAENRRAAEKLGELFAEEVIRKHEDKKKGKFITFGEYFETVFLVSSKKYYAEGTYQLNENTIKNNFLETFRDIPVCAITKEMLQKKIEELLQRQNKNINVDELEDPIFIKSQTVIRYVSTFRAVINMAIDDGIIDKDPFEGGMRYPKVYHTPVTCLDEEDYEKIIRDLNQKANNLTLGISDMIVAIGLHAGLRRGETVALRWRDIRGIEKGANNILRISVEHSAVKPKGKPQKIGNVKSDASVRQFTIPESLAKILRTWRTMKEKEGVSTGEDDFVIPGEINGMICLYSPTKIFKEYLEELELKDVKLHSLRHTFASILIGKIPNPAQVQYIMGHKDSKVTQIYIHAFGLMSDALMASMNAYNSEILNTTKEKK